MSEVVVVIPAYNESENILNLCEEIVSFNSSVDILVVDDSADTLTYDLIQNRKHSRICIIHRGVKSGRGQAVLHGYRESFKKKYRYYVEMDADFSHSVADLAKLLDCIKATNSDLVIASRYLKESRILNWPLRRRVFSYLANQASRFFLNIPLTDCNHGFRVYSCRAIEAIVKKSSFRSHGFFVLTECLALIYYRGYKVAECSCIFTNRVRGESKLRFSEIYAAMRGLIKITIEYRLKGV